MKMKRSKRKTVVVSKGVKFIRCKNRKQENSRSKKIQLLRQQHKSDGMSKNDNKSKVT